MAKRPSSARVNKQRVKEVAQLVTTLTLEPPLNFYSYPDGKGGEFVAKDMYPPLHAPWTIDFFFLVGIHQHGFWLSDAHGYTGPLMGTWNGKKNVKGSDLLWRVILREFLKDPSRLQMVDLAIMDYARFVKIFSDDNGPIPLLATSERYELTRNYAHWFLSGRSGNRSPWEFVDRLQQVADPARTLLATLADPERGCPGYNEDPLRKKALLLLMSLVNRPEKIIVLEHSFTWKPIVDYHLMRLAARLRLIDIPTEWRAALVERRFVPPDWEASIRKATYDAVDMVSTESGISAPMLDGLMWEARRYCPEMTEPECGKCKLAPACAKRKKLFQPIIRTTFY